MAAALPDPVIAPVLLAQITLKSGVQYVWSGVGPLVWKGKTYAGLGEFAGMGEITENAAVQAEGTTVTLRGIGLSQVPALPPGVTPPTMPTPPAGQSIAWSLAKRVTVPAPFSNPPNIYNSFLGNSGSASGTLTAGSLGLINGTPLGTNFIELVWDKFSLPDNIPPGATVVNIVPVFYVGGYSAGGFQSVNSSLPWAHNVSGTGLLTGSSLGTTIPGGLTLSAYIQNTLAGAAHTGFSLDFVGLAVYYEDPTGLGPSSTASLVYEALNDIRQGAPARIWFGLWDAAGAGFVGQPYKIFDGSVDKPETKLPDPQTGQGGTITLALESRMVDLARASNRKLTSADQRYSYADDNGLNWVEILQLISLKEGT